MIGTSEKQDMYLCQEREEAVGCGQRLAIAPIVEDSNPLARRAGMHAADLARLKRCAARLSPVRRLTGLMLRYNPCTGIHQL